MEENYVGKTLKNENNEEFVVLSQIRYKNIPCVYAMKVQENDEEGEKSFFQIASDNGIYLVSINSPKMIETLFDVMFKENANNEKPRKIKDNESIPDYFAYLDDYYKTKVTTIL